MTAEKDDGYVRWRCKQCGQKLKVKETYEGGNVIRCPRCGAPTNVPLANLDAIAEGTDMEETGKPGQLRLDPDRLVRQLSQEGKGTDQPGSEGSSPSLREKPWSPGARFGRIEQLDQLASAIAKINQETMGEVQRLYRDRSLNASQRAEEMKNAGEHRRERLANLVTVRLEALNGKIQPLEDAHDRLSKAELNALAGLKRAREALRFYGRFVLGIDP